MNAQLFQGMINFHAFGAIGSRLKVRFRRLKRFHTLFLFQRFQYSLQFLSVFIFMIIHWRSY